MSDAVLLDVVDDALWSSLGAFAPVNGYVYIPGLARALMDQIPWATDIEEMLPDFLG